MGPAPLVEGVKNIVWDRLEIKMSERVWDRERERERERWQNKYWHRFGRLAGGMRCPAACVRLTHRRRVNGLTRPWTTRHHGNRRKLETIYHYKNAKPILLEYICFSLCGVINKILLIFPWLLFCEIKLHSRDLPHRRLYVYNILYS